MVLYMEQIQKMGETSKKTTISVKNVTISRINGFKVHHRETNDECLNRLMDKLE